MAYGIAWQDGPIKAAHKYIRAIRNVEKRRYAYALLTYYIEDTGREPDRGPLSVMGAQAVRMNLTELLDRT